MLEDQIRRKLQAARSAEDRRGIEQALIELDRLYVAASWIRRQDPTIRRLRAFTRREGQVS